MKKEWNFFCALLLDGLPGAFIQAQSWFITGHHHYISRLIAYPFTTGSPEKDFVQPCTVPVYPGRHMDIFYLPACKTSVTKIRL